jgi:Fe-S-cluster containining protein
MSVDSGLLQIVQAASQRPQVREAVAEIYAELARRIEERKPICVLSGRCCHFEEYGHRLYVTTMELAAFKWELSRVAGEGLTCHQGAGGETPPLQALEKAGCSFQKGKLCTVHSIRPFGCRIFFCDPTATQWQQDQYEHFHSELKREHERLGVPYRYMEWREALEKVGI